jgi:hypothetical protein
MGAIQGAKNQALFREAANEWRRDLDEAFKQAMGETRRAGRATGSRRRGSSSGSASPKPSSSPSSPGRPGLLRDLLDQPTGLLGTIVILTPFGVLAWAAFGLGFYRLVA